MAPNPATDRLGCGTTCEVVLKGLFKITENEYAVELLLDSSPQVSECVREDQLEAGLSVEITAECHFGLVGVNENTAGPSSHAV